MICEKNTESIFRKLKERYNMTEEITEKNSASIFKNTLTGATLYFENLIKRYNDHTSCEKYEIYNQKSFTGSKFHFLD